MNLNALIIVLLLGAIAFFFARKVAGSLIEDREFALWRNAWFATTIAAFICSNLFVFELVVAIICLYAYAVGAASIELFFVLLFAAPLADAPITGFGIVNNIFALNNGRMLAIALLVPLLLFRGGFTSRTRKPFALPDWCIIGYVLLVVALGTREYSFTAVMRLAMVQTLDVLVPYFAFSRLITTTADLPKVFLAFITALFPMLLIGPFEMVKGWHLYGSIAQDWGTGLVYTRRDAILRATGSANDPINLGVMMMVATGCMLVFWKRVSQSRTFGAIILAMLSAGLIAPLSRGPWLSTALMVLIYLVISPNAFANVGRVVALSIMATIFLVLTPIGQRVMEFLPFVGSIEAGSSLYRQRLFEHAITVLGENPWFGSVDYLSTPEMRQMIQGEGIIDIVNTYLLVALNSGLIGLSLFICFFATVLLGLRRTAKSSPAFQPDIAFAVYVRASTATLLAILVEIATVSPVGFIPYIYWSFAGLCVALVRVDYGPRRSGAHHMQAVVPGSRIDPRVTSSSHRTDGRNRARH